jgi:hypothetical protein
MLDDVQKRVDRLWPAPALRRGFDDEDRTALRAIACALEIAAEVVVGQKLENIPGTPLEHFVNNSLARIHSRGND